MKLTLTIPGLTWLDAHDGAELTRGLATPALARLLGRARRRQQPLALSQLLAQPFSVSGAQLAQLAAQQDGLDCGSGHWLIADPAHLRIDRDRALLADVGVMRLDQNEADALVQALNLHFAADGLRFHAPKPGRWYLQHPQPAEAVFTPLADAIGENIDAHRPRGTSGLAWSRTLNEIQMLLFSHPVNQEREARGDTPVNSVWLWGDGAPAKPRTADCIIYSGDESVRLLATASNSTLQDPPYSLSLWLESHPAGKDAWIHLDRLQAAAQYRDAWGWREGLNQLEQDWFAPVLQAMHQGAVSELRIQSHGDAGLSAGLSRADLWKFWKRAHALAECY